MPLPAGALRVPPPTAAVSQLAERWRGFLLVHCVLGFPAHSGESEKVAEPELVLGLFRKYG